MKNILRLLTGYKRSLSNTINRTPLDATSSSRTPLTPEGESTLYNSIAPAYRTCMPLRLCALIFLCAFAPLRDLSAQKAIHELPAKTTIDTNYLFIQGNPTTGKLYKTRGAALNALISGGGGIATDTTSLSNRIDLKLNISDTTGLSNRIDAIGPHIDTTSLSNRIDALSSGSTDTTSLSNRIDAIPTISSLSKNAGRDSTILLLSSGTRYAVKDSIGAGSGGGSQTLDQTLNEGNTTDTGIVFNKREPLFPLITIDSNVFGPNDGSVTIWKVKNPDSDISNLIGDFNFTAWSGSRSATNGLNNFVTVWGYNTTAGGGLETNYDSGIHVAMEGRWDQGGGANYKEFHVPEVTYHKADYSGVEKVLRAQTWIFDVNPSARQAQSTTTATAWTLGILPIGFDGSSSISSFINVTGEAIDFQSVAANPYIRMHKTGTDLDTSVVFQLTGTYGQNLQISAPGSISLSAGGVNSYGFNDIIDGNIRITNNNASIYFGLEINSMSAINGPLLVRNDTIVAINVTPDGNTLFGNAYAVDLDYTINVTGGAKIYGGLDIESTTDGISIPRMTTTQRDAISSPGEGLQVYNTTTHELNIHNGSAWGAIGGGGGASQWTTSGSDIYYNTGQTLVANGTVAAPGIAFYNQSGTGIFQDGYVGDGMTFTDRGVGVLNVRQGGIYISSNIIAAADNAYAIGFYNGRISRIYATILTPSVGSASDPSYSFDDGANNPMNGGMFAGGTYNSNYLGFSTSGTERMRIHTNGNILLGTTTDDNSALLNITSTTKGFLPPRMTKTQRDAISSPATGLVVYQTDNTPGLRCYNGTNWMRYTETAD